MKRYVLYGQRRSRGLGSPCLRGVVVMEGGGGAAWRGRMGHADVGTEKEQAGRGLLQSLKWGGDGRWVAACRELVSKVAGYEGFRGCVFRAAASV